MRPEGEENFGYDSWIGALETWGYDMIPSIDKGIPGRTIFFSLRGGQQHKSYLLEELSLICEPLK